MKDRWDYLISYAWLLFRIGLATLLIVFWLWFDWSGDLILPFIDGSFKTNLASTWGDLHPAVSWTLKVVVGMLVWWRVVKVFALHGSPFLGGIEAAPGRFDNKGVSGRYVTTMHIGSSDAYGSNAEHVDKIGFWYGAIFIAHPNSDKLVRSRMELLLLTISPQRAFIIHASRFLIFKGGHLERARYFRRLSDKYHENTSPKIPSESSFRQRLSSDLSGISRTLKEIKTKLK